jgi:hypothetical protein
MFSHQLRLGTLAASLVVASGAFAAGSVTSPHPSSLWGASPHQGSLVVAQVERIGPKQDDPRALKPNPNRGSLAIGPKQDDPRQGIIVQGGRSDGLAIGPKQDDPRALKPNPNSRSRGLTPNPN